MTDLDKGLRILIVENNPGDRYLLTELLRTSIIKFHLPETAETLEKAIELLRTTRFDIILLDLSLPDSVGIDTIKSVKDFAGDTPVIILSGINDINMVTEAIRLGAQDYHVKEEMNEKLLTRTILYSIERNEFLRTTRQNYASLVNTVDGIVWEADARSFTFTFVSERAERLLGYPVSKWLEEPNFWGDHIHPDDRNGAIDYCVACTRQMIPHEFEYRMIAADGRIVWLKDIVTVIIENDEPVQLRGIMIDISKQKMIEAALESSEKNLRQVLSSTADNFYVIDRDFRITLINQSAEQNLKLAWGAPVSIGTNILDVIPGEEEEPIRASLKKVFAGEKVEYELHLTVNGLPEWLLVSYMPVVDEHAVVIGAYIRSKDISERKRIEAGLKRSIERFEMIAATTHDAIWEWNLETGEIWGNAVHQRMYGLTVSDPAPGEEMWEQRIHPDDREAILADLEKTFASDKDAWISEYRFLTSEGYRNIYDRSYIVRDENQKPVRIMGSMMDITERTIAEEHLKSSQKQLLASIENTPNVAVQWYNRKGEVVFWNHASELIFGWESSEAMGKSLDKLIYTPGDMTEFLESIDFIEKTGETIGPVEFSFLRKDGSKGVCLYTLFSIHNLSGEPCFVCMDVDITERKKAEEAIKESEEKYRNLIEQASDPIITYSLDGRIVSCNNAFATSLGYAKTDIVNLRITDLLFEEDLKINPLRFEQIKKGKAVHDQRRVRRKDGSEMPVELNSKLMPGGDVMVIARDITERKKAEKLLLKEKDFSDSVINNLPGIFAMLDEEGNFLRWNKNFETISGYNTEEILTLSPTSLVDSDQVDFAVKKLQEGFTLGETSAEIKLLTRNKEKIPYYFNGWRVFIEDKPCLIGIGYDLTERKKADFLVRTSEEKYRTLVEQAVDAIALYDESGKILDVNTGSVNLLGYSKGELIQMNLSDVLTEQEIKIEPVHYDILQKGGSTVRQRLMKKKDGSVVQTEVRSQQLPDGRFLAVIRDLTERITAQEQIEREKELSDSIINSLPGLFYLIDEKARYVRWNKLKEQISGYNTEEIRSMTALDFFEGEEKELIRRKIKDGFTKGTTEVEAHFVTKSGKKILFYFTGIAIEYEGQKCLMGTGIDISDRKEAELELESSYKAIRQLTEHLQNIREEERTHIAREIHDELGQKLTVLKMDISWINKKLTEKDDVVKARLKELLTMLDDTVKSVRRISSELRPSLLDDLGLTAAMEWHLNEFQKRFDIRTHFKSVDEILLPEAMKTGLFRIFQESLTNVARHASAKKVSVSLERENGSVVLCVTDDGVGFDKQNAAAKKTLGILGMKERTSMIGGTYEIISKPGKGTKVVVTIPLNNKTGRL